MYSISYTVSPTPLIGPWNYIGNGSAGDFNTDGFKDIAFSTDISSSLNPFKTPVAVYIFDSQTASYKLFPLTIDGVSNSFPQVYFGRDAISVDINHDGICDLIPFDGSEILGDLVNATFVGQEQFAYISNGVGNYSRISLSAGPVNVHGGGVIKSADGIFRVLLNTPWSDYRENGTATAICSYDNQAKSFNTQLITRHDKYFTDAPQNGWSGYFYQATIDVNNDGNSDIIGFSTDGGANNLYLNDGHGDFIFSKSINTGLRTGISVQDCAVGDFNGDGFQDIVILGISEQIQPTFEFKSLRILINDKHSNLVDQTDQWLHEKFQNANINGAWLYASDINNDGRTDFTYAHDNRIDPSAGVTTIFLSTGADFELFETPGSGNRIPISNNQWAQNYAGGVATFTVNVQGGTPANKVAKAYTPFDGVSSTYAIALDTLNNRLISKLNNDYFLLDKSVERLQFTDTNLALDVGPTQNAGSVYMLYKAAFNRASDPSGMGYWLAQKDSGKDIVTNLAQGFVNSSEFIAKYGSNPTNSSYVDKLYQNVLGRAGEAGGVAYWNQQLDAGKISKAAVLVQFATLAEGASLVANEIDGGIAYQQWVG